MSNQLQITGGAKVRNLEGVLTGSSGVVSSLGINVPDGVPQLDGSGKILVSQLPNSVMEYKGTWNVATNTPYLVNGVGNAGDVYIVEGAATEGTPHDFGAGSITFYNGDQTIYNGSIWQKASGASGAVTSVAVSRSGDALLITGSPITTTGTINIGFAGNGSQYIKGDGTLATFPTIIGETTRLITEVYNETGATLSKGTIVYINGGHGNLPTITKAIATSDATSAQTYGVVQSDITNNNNGYVVVIGSLNDIDTQAYAEGTQLYLSGTTAGAWTSTKPHAPIHLVYVGIVVRSHPTQGIVEVRIQNGYELEELHDVAITSVANTDGIFYNSSNDLWENKTIAEVLGYTPANGADYVPYTGATTNVNLGTNILTANQLWTSGTSNSGLFMNQSSAITAPEDSSTYTSIKSYTNRYLYFSFGQTSAYKRFRFDVNGLTDNTTLTYTMPNSSGTLALTSDIPSLTNYVTLDGTQTITGQKTFTSLIYANNNIVLPIAGSSSITYLANIAGTGMTSSGANYIGFNTNNDFYFAKDNYNSCVFVSNNSAVNYYTLQDGSGTLAFTSDIPSLTNYVTLTGSQTITGIKTFSNEALFGNNITLTGGDLVIASGSYNSSLNSVTLSANRNIDFPDASGVVALTSDLNSYVPTSRTITINGTTQDLSANQTWTITPNVNATNTQDYTATAGQTTFTVTGGYTVGQLAVYYNGSKLAAAEYTATDGSTFVLATACQANDIVQAVVEVTGGGIGGSGTTNYISKWTASGVLGNSVLQESGGNIGIGVAPNSTLSGYTFVNIGDIGNQFGGGVANPFIASNAYYSSGWKYATTGYYAALYEQNNGAHNFKYAASGTANAGFSFNTAMTINSSGSVGIGTSSPQRPLEVVGTIRNTNPSGSNFSQIYNDATGAWWSTGAYPMMFETNGTERMRITSSGNVGIGTTSPSQKLTLINGTFQIGGTSTFSDNVEIGRVGGDNNMAFATGGSERMRITSSGQMIVGDTSMTYGNNIGYVAGFKGASANQTFVSIAKSGQSLSSQGFMIGLDNSAAYLYNHDNTPIAFFTNGSERMRITSGGQIFIGKSADAMNTPGIVLNPSGTAVYSFAINNNEAFILNNINTGTNYKMDFRTNAVSRGNINVTDSSVAYNTTSDYRLKEDFKEINGLEKVSAIKVYDFKWKSIDERMNGVIAHELQEVLPYAVTGEKDAVKEDGTIIPQGVDYSKLVPILVKAIQEQQAQIDELKAKIN